jgi:hypothetical protein
LYVDGVLDSSAPAQGSILRSHYPVYIGENAQLFASKAEQRKRGWNGLIDDVRIYDCALSEAQVKDLFVETVGNQATMPKPSDGEYLARSSAGTQLSWTPAKDAAAYKVYFGTDPNNLSPLGTVKDVTSIQSPGLDERQQYYWRVDATKSDGSAITGQVWTFSTGRLSARSLIGWWKFDGDASDSSGYRHHGIENGAPTYTPGMSGQALSLRGVGDHVLIRSLGTLVNGLEALTVSLWVKSNETRMDRGFVIFEDPVPIGYPSGGDDNRDIRYDAAGSGGRGINVIKCAITSSATTGTVPGRQQLESASNVQTSQWQHLAMTWSSGNFLKLYINGVEDKPTWREPASVGRLIGYTKLIVGKGGKDLGPSRSWNGLIDDVRIYDYALSEEEIKALHDSSVQDDGVAPPAGKP